MYSDGRMTQPPRHAETSLSLSVTQLETSLSMISRRPARPYIRDTASSLSTKLSETSPSLFVTQLETSLSLSMTQSETSPSLSATLSETISSLSAINTVGDQLVPHGEGRLSLWLCHGEGQDSLQLYHGEGQAGLCIAASYKGRG